jgi:hypothetical protein
MSKKRKADAAAASGFDTLPPCPKGTVCKETDPKHTESLSHPCTFGTASFFPAYEKVLFDSSSFGL